MRLPGVLLGLTAVLAPHAALTAGDKYKISGKEKAACTVDAMRLCLNTYPDEDLLLSCMKSNRASLSATCLSAFDAGLKRRHL